MMLWLGSPAHGGGTSTRRSGDGEATRSAPRAVSWGWWTGADCRPRLTQPTRPG